MTALLDQPRHKNGKAPTIVKEQVRIAPANIKTIRLKITGTAPYLQCRFPQKAIDKIKKKQLAGDQGGKRARHQPRDFESDYQGSMHRMGKNEFGIPAAAFRAAAISACRLVGYKMTIAKMSVFVVADGYDVLDRTPLVKINGAPEKNEMMGRNRDGSCDIRVRAMWPMWSAAVTVQFDADQFSSSDVFNLFDRVGKQVGIGEGRPDSKESAGLGFGLFKIEV